MVLFIALYTLPTYNLGTWSAEMLPFYSDVVAKWGSTVHSVRVWVRTGTKLHVGLNNRDFLEKILYTYTLPYRDDRSLGERTPPGKLTLLWPFGRGPGNMNHATLPGSSSSPPRPAEEHQTPGPGTWASTPSTQHTGSQTANNGMKRCVFRDPHMSKRSLCNLINGAKEQNGFV